MIDMYVIAKFHKTVKRLPGYRVTKENHVYKQKKNMCDTHKYFLYIGKNVGNLVTLHRKHLQNQYLQWFERLPKRGNLKEILVTWVTKKEEL